MELDSKSFSNLCVKINTMKRYVLLLVLIGMYLVSCTPPATETTPNEELEYGNPAAEGFNEAASDAKAIAIADEVMEALGGRKAWDDTRYIRWTFFGRRTLLWDKQTGNVRIDSPGDSSVYLVNVFDHTGKVMLKKISIHLCYFSKIIL